MRGLHLLRIAGALLGHFDLGQVALAAAHIVAALADITGNADVFHIYHLSVHSMAADCDADALVVEVVKSGPACHTGAESCFFNEVYVSPELKQFSWQGLYQLIKGRKDSPKEGSYTTYLFEKGKEKILKKVGEECTEVIIAGEKEDKEETVYEISDLAYHVLVLMVSAGITVEDVTRELEKRHVIDHKVKQERMQ